MAGYVLPKTKYARSGDVRIAYQITGNEPFDVVGYSLRRISATFSIVFQLRVVAATPNCFSTIAFG